MNGGGIIFPAEFILTKDLPDTTQPPGPNDITPFLLLYSQLQQLVNLPLSTIVYQTSKFMIRLSILLCLAICWLSTGYAQTDTTYWRRSLSTGANINQSSF